jgi:hypothetical protein
MIDKDSASPKVHGQNPTIVYLSEQELAGHIGGVLPFVGPLVNPVAIITDPAFIRSLFDKLIRPSGSG